MGVYHHEKAPLRFRPPGAFFYLMLQLFFILLIKDVYLRCSSFTFLVELNNEIRLG